MREIIPEPISKPPEDGVSGRVLVAVIALILGGAAVSVWMERSQKQKAREARYHEVNGSQRLTSSWSRLQIGQSSEEVESLLGPPSKKHPTCWYYTPYAKDYVDESEDDPKVYFDIHMRVRGWVSPR
jgi:hypothetical protein